MALKKRAKIVLWALGIVVVLGLLLSVAGWRFYKVYRNPDRFLEMARNLINEQENEAAMDQYRRALGYARDNQRRADILREMAETLKAKSPLPVEEAFKTYQSILSLWAGVCRADRDDQNIRRQLLESQFRVAQQADVQWAWRGLQDVSEMLLRIDDKNTLAEKYQVIARLKLDEGETEEAVFYEQINSSLQELWDLNPDDEDLPYYISVSNLSQAATNEGDYMPMRGRTLVESAIKRVDEFADAHPDNLEARIARLKILLQSAWLLKEFERLPQIREEVAELETALADSDRHAELAMELAHLVVLAHKLQAVAEADTDDEASVSIPASEQQKNLDHAQHILQNALANNPDNIRLLLRIAINHREAKRLEDAKEWLEKVLEPREIAVNADAVGAWNAQLHARFLLADVMLQIYETAPEQKKSGETISRVREQIRQLEDIVDSDSPYLQLLEGRLAYHHGNYRLAVRKLTEAEEKLGRRTPETALFSGLGLAHLGETGAAVRRLSEFLSSPGATVEHRERAWLEMAASAIRLREFDQAVKIARKLLEQNPEDQQTNLLLGRALMMQLLTGRVTDREEIFQEVIGLLEPLAKKGNSEALRQLAEVHEFAGDWPAAKELLTRHCRENPQDASALVQLYNGLRRADNQKEAKKWIRDALNDLPDSKAVELVHRAIDGDAKLRNHINTLMNIAIDDDPVSRHLDLFQFFRQQGDDAQAEQMLAEADNRAPDNPRVLEANFNYALQQNQVDRAKQLLEDFEESDAGDVDKQTWRAQLHMTQQEHSRAIDELNAAVDNDPNRSELYRLLGEAFRQKGDLFKAEENFRKALELKPNQPDTLRRLIQVSAARGLHHQALKYMRQALAFSPGDEQLMRVFLNYLSEHGSTAEALEIRLRLASVRPNDFANRRAIADLYLRSNEPEQARGVLQKLIEDAPDDFANIISMAWLEARTGKTDQGKQRIQTFLRTHEDDVEHTQWLQYAEFLRRIDEDEEAEQAAQTAIDMDTSATLEATQYIAELHLENDRPKEAIKTYKKLLDEKNMPSARLGLARAFLQLDEPEKCLSEIHNLEAADELFPGLFRLKAEALVKLNRYDEAYKAADQAVTRNSEDARSYFLRAQAKFNDPDEDQQKQVLRDLNKALELNSRMPRARLLLTDWYARNNRIDEAVTEARRLMDRYPNVGEFKRNLAELLLRGSMYERLQQHLQEWAEAMPDDPAIARYQAELAEARGQLTEAIEAWKTVVEQSPTQQALHRYISTLVKAGRAATAVDVVENNSDEISANPASLALYGRALMLTDQTEKGHSVFRSALSAAAKSPRAQQNVIRQAREVLGADELLPLLAEAANEDNTGMISLVMGQLQLSKGELQEGVQELEKLRSELSEDSPIRGQLLTTLGTAYTQLGDNQRAQQTYRAALQAIPDDPVVLNNLAYAMATEGSDPYEAVKLAQRAVDSGGHTENALAFYLDTLGFAQYRADLLFHARNNLERSINLEPMPANTYHLGLVHLEEDNPLEAKRALEQAAQLAEKADGTEYKDDIKAAQQKADELVARMPKNSDENEEQPRDADEPEAGDDEEAPQAE
ncbi:MAG: tetratricopeptide repeat protein [Verrucomicrobiota bacterium]